MNLGEQIKTEREKLELSQSQLAEAIGTSHQNINRWEKGEILPNILFCIKLADFFGLTLDELVGRNSEH